MPSPGLVCALRCHSIATWKTNAFSSSVCFVKLPVPSAYLKAFCSYCCRIQNRVCKAGGWKNFVFQSHCKCCHSCVPAINPNTPIFEEQLRANTLCLYLSVFLVSYTWPLPPCCLHSSCLPKKNQNSLFPGGLVPCCLRQKIQSRFSKAGILALQAPLWEVQ